MNRPEGWVHRGPRPTTAWAVSFMVWCLALFVAVVLAAIAAGFWLTAGRGESVPNLTGGLENFGAVLAAIFGAGGIGGLIFNQRHRERMDQQARGQAPSPFDPGAQSAEPSPTGGYINNEALE